MVALTQSRIRRGIFSLLAFFVAFCVAGTAFAQANAQASASADATGAEAGQGHILLVLPFDNLTDPTVAGAASQLSKESASESPAQANLDWIGEAVPEILNSRFSSSGFLPLNREDRLYALDHLGFPQSFQPSRATALRLAETLDADSIIFGTFAAKGSQLTIKARIVDVPKLRLSAEVTETGEISQLINLLNSLAWKLTRTLDPKFGVAEETFRAAGSKLRLDAFEQYIRGLTERDSDERLRHLKRATELNPGFIEAWVATGRQQFETQQYDQAAISYAKVPRGDPAELEAGFYRGLAQIFSGNYAHAEESFAAVARVLPLPEVVNNQGVAISRRGHDAIAQYRQAEAADPTDPDYHFNLAVSLNREGKKAEALAELGQCLRLRSTDSEAKALTEAWTAEEKPQSEQTVTEPLERIKRSYNGAAFRQAALMLDQVEAARLEALPAPQRALNLSHAAHEKLDRGLLLEAEREYQAALDADQKSAEAHAGLAEVRERAGDAEIARTEAHAALDLKPNLEAYLVLARLDLASNHFNEARDEVMEAIHMDAQDRTARELRRAVDARIEAEQKATAAKAEEAGKGEKPAEKTPEKE